MKTESVVSPVPGIPQDRLLTSSEVCRILNIRRLGLYELIRRGEIESIRIGRLHRFLPSAVTGYIQRQTAGGTGR